jgi:hypothetical protein
LSGAFFALIPLFFSANFDKRVVIVKGCV